MREERRKRWKEESRKKANHFGKDEANKISKIKKIAEFENETLKREEFKTRSYCGKNYVQPRMSGREKSKNKSILK